MVYYDTARSVRQPLLQNRAPPTVGASNSDGTLTGSRLEGPLWPRQGSLMQLQVADSFTRAEGPRLLARARQLVWLSARVPWLASTCPLVLHWARLGFSVASPLGLREREQKLLTSRVPSDRSPITSAIIYWPKQITWPTQVQGGREIDSTSW